MVRQRTLVGLPMIELLNAALFHRKISIFDLNLSELRLRWYHLTYVLKRQNLIHHRVIMSHDRTVLRAPIVLPLLHRVGQSTLGIPDLVR